MSRIVFDSDIILKQLAYENANKPCQTALRKTASLSDFIRICADIGPAYVQGAALGTALTQAPGNIKGPQGKVMKAGNSCFRSGGAGHFARECPTRNLAGGSGSNPMSCGRGASKPKAPGVCP